MRRMKFFGFLLVACCLGLTLQLAGPGPAGADMEDAAIFYEDLAKYGEWIDFEDYGPVWRPSGVTENWRPYLDGRWAPTDQGYVFETKEPWGWATYHFGNWMPTDAYGWVWVPGHTWYPNTVEWRTSKDYVGWAPIPPPNYTPPPGYKPEGYSPRKPAAEQVAPPSYLFASSDKFLQGLGQPYTPSYSYLNSGAMAPPTYVPVLYPVTQPVPAYAAPTYYPGLLGLAAGIGLAYALGPPVSYVSSVSGVPAVTINNVISGNSINFGNINGVLPPAPLINQPALQPVLPPNLVQQQPLPNPQLLPAVQPPNLVNPAVAPLPPQIQPLSAKVPKAPAVAPLSPAKGIVAAALPASAVKPLSPAMQKQINQLPPSKQIKPVAPLAKAPAAPLKPAAPIQPVKPGVKAPAKAPAKPPEPPKAPAVKPPAPPKAPPKAPPAPPKPALKAPAPSKAQELQERREKLLQERQQQLQERKQQLQERQQQQLKERQQQLQERKQQQLKERQQKAKAAPKAKPKVQPKGPKPKPKAPVKKGGPEPHPKK